MTADALSPFEAPTSAVKQENPTPLPYLQEGEGYKSYDIHLEVSLRPASSSTCTEPVVISKSNFRNMYWTPRQQLVHHSVTGCNMRAGDLLGSGTISGQEQGTFGSMLELSWSGKNPIQVGSETRTFIEDGDQILVRGVCKGEGFQIGFGECDGLVLPAVPNSAL